jgi:hypothetical protein
MEMKQQPQPTIFTRSKKDSYNEIISKLSALKDEFTLLSENENTDTGDLFEALKNNIEDYTTYSFMPPKASGYCEKCGKKL